MILIKKLLKKKSKIGSSEKRKNESRIFSPFPTGRARGSLEANLKNCAYKDTSCNFTSIAMNVYIKR